MNSPPHRVRFLAPYPLFAGVILSFLTCCVLGHRAEHWNYFRDFVRFNWFTSPDTFYYPTAGQVRTLADAQIDRQQIAVIIGGNSILHGVGQRPEAVWTRRLQGLLGDQYRVLNLAMDGAAANEFGEWAAEIIARDHPRYVFVTDFGSAGAWADVDGEAYRFFFWDAHDKGLLPTSPEREQCVREKLAKRRNDEAFAELRRGLELDGYVGARDMWMAIAYRWCSTVWNPHMGKDFLRARCRCLDPERGSLPPLEDRYPAKVNTKVMAQVRSMLSFGAECFPPHPPGPPQGLEPLFRTLFPGEARRHTLILVTTHSPYYTNQLAGADRAAYYSNCRQVSQGLEEYGFASLPVGVDWGVDDYLDLCHLSEQGGRKLADVAAVRIRSLAQQLGYVEGKD